MATCIDDFQQMGAAATLTGCSNRNDTSDLDAAGLCKLYDAGECQPIIDFQFQSVNVEFVQLCGEAKRIKDSTSYQMIGYMIGAFVFGQVSDAFGRKWPMLLSVTLTAIFGWVSSFAQSLTMFTLWRTLLTFFNTGNIVIVMVYMCEKFPRQHRMWLNFVFSWSPNLMFVAIIAYFAGDWRTFSRILNSLGFAAGLILLFLEDSVHWMIRQGRVADAEKSMRRIYKINGHELNEKELSVVLEHEKLVAEQKKTKTSYFFHHLFCTWTLTGYTFTMIFSFFAVSVINYGIMFNMDHLDGSIYTNTIFIGGFRYLLNILSAVIDYNFPKIGRKTSHMFFSGYTIVVIAISIGLNLSGIDSVFTRYLVMSAGAMVVQIYVVNGVMCSEIFPTAVRNIAYATTQVSGAIGSIIGPQVFLLASIAWFVPYVVMLALQLGETFSTIAFIPESKGQALADQMPEPSECFRLFRPRAEKQDKVSAA